MAEDEKQIHLSENLQEDFHIESNPSLFFPEEDPSLPKALQVIGTELRPEFVSHINNTRHYMGSISMVYSKFRYIRHRRVFIEIPEEKWNNPIAQTEDSQALNEITIQPQTRGLLHLPDYIKARIIDISMFVTFSEKYKDEIARLERIGQGLDILEKRTDQPILKRNIQRFVRNNSVTLYSDDLSKQFHLFCPMISRHTSAGVDYWTLKFLRVNKREFAGDDIDYEIYPIIYTLYLPKKFQDLKIPLHIEGEVVNLLCNIKRSATDLFPKGITFYDPSAGNKKLLKLQDDNPVDCVTVSMQLCGFLDQPDVMRYHNIFRAVRIRKIDDELDINLSAGLDTFVTDLIGSKVISFFNRRNPSAPLKNINTLVVMTRGNKEDISTNKSLKLIKEVNGVKIFHKTKALEKDIYYVQAFKLGNTLAQDLAYFKETLHKLGLNRPNVFYSVGIPYHQVTMSYDHVNDNYVVRDYQVNKEYTDRTVRTILEHPNFSNGNSYYEFYSLETRVPSDKCNLIGPELRLMYDWHRDPKQYIGDPFPVIREYINNFIREYSTEGKAPVYPIPRVRSSIYDLNLKTTAVIEDLRSELTQEYLGMVQHPIPQVYNTKISLYTYPFMISTLDRAIASVQIPARLKEIRQYIKTFVEQNGDEIISQYKSRLYFFSRLFLYTREDVYNLLLSRPVFCAMMYDRPNHRGFITVIANYLYENTKPTLDISQFFEYIIQQAARDQIQIPLLRHLSSLKDYPLSRLIDVAREISGRIEVKQPGFFSRLFSSQSIKKELYSAVYLALAENVPRRMIDDVRGRQAQARAIYQIASKNVLLPSGRPLTKQKIVEFYEQNDAYLQAAKLEYSRHEEFMPSPDEPDEPELEEVKVSLLSEDNVEDTVLRLLEDKDIPYEEQPILGYEELQSIPQKRREEVLRRYTEYDTRKRQALSLIKERVKTRRLSRINRGETEEQQEERELENSLIRILIEKMIEAKQDELLRLPLEQWMEADRAILERERDKRRAVVSVRDYRLDAYDVFVSLMTILKNITPELDRNFLGVR
jgi:hypothetical protein